MLGGSVATGLVEMMLIDACSVSDAIFTVAGLDVSIALIMSLAGLVGVVYSNLSVYGRSQTPRNSSVLRPRRYRRTL